MMWVGCMFGHMYAFMCGDGMYNHATWHDCDTMCAVVCDIFLHDVVDDRYCCVVMWLRSDVSYVNVCVNAYMCGGCNGFHHTCYIIV